MSETLLNSFAGANGIYPKTSVIYQGGILYGTASDGGGSFKQGTLFSYNVSTNTLGILYSFPTGTISINGKNPQASVIYVNESGIGKLYGTTNAGGTSNKGTLFSYNLSTNTFTTFYNFTGIGSNGSQPQASVIYQGGILYGTTLVGGDNDKGTLFSYDLTSSILTTLYSFTGTDGSQPSADVIYRGGILYGNTNRGGSNDKGTLFSYDLASSTLTTLYSFNETDGTRPSDGVIYENGILYGTTKNGGSSNLGTLFSYDLASGNLTTLHSFTGTGTDGSQSIAGVIYENGILYGTTLVGGSNNLGTLFSYNLTTNTLTTLYSFTGQPTDGSQPYSRVIYQGGILYGTTYSGGSGNQGTLFSYTITPPTPIPISNICFPIGTLISTDQGEISIEKIVPFENTINNKKIKAITNTISRDTYLVCFDKNALGNNYPDKKTMMSKEHKILYKGKMIEAYKFLDHFEKVQKVDYNQEILYNVLMEKYEKIKVNNIVCETLHPNNIIAKLYNSNYGEEYKNKIIYIMNESINKKDTNSYKKIVNHIFN